jgi:hypothetical protein
MKLRYLRILYFAWLLVPPVIYMAVATHGLPHLVWKTQGINYPSGRFHSRCTYVGPYGTYTVQFPKAGDCPIIRLFKSEGRA